MNRSIPVVDPVALAQALVRCPSVTPEDGGAMTLLGGTLESLGFAVHRMRFGEAPDGPVENLFAVRGTGGPHLAFAGHTDVVPPGEGWTCDPFAAEIRGDLLYGRGTVDMKGAIAAFVAAAAEIDPQRGTLSLIITGDEEGPATFGTDRLLDWMMERGHKPDFCLVGEPTSEARLGDVVKIGRRGSVNVWITVKGVQGHVAYPHKADNPITRLVRLLDRLKSRILDEGTEWFAASNLEVTDLSVGNQATNIIPGSARARLNIRFNDSHRGADLVRWIEQEAAEIAPGTAIEAKISGEAFLTPPGPLSDAILAAIKAETGIAATLSTSGGTSDARFVRRLCPVAEFGLCNATMHKLDEAVAVADLHRLQNIYRSIIERLLSGGG